MKNYALQKPHYVAARLLHKAPNIRRGLHSCFAFYLQIGDFAKWAMLGSNQRPLPCEGSTLPRATVDTRIGNYH